MPPPQLPGVVESGRQEHEGRQREWLSYVTEGLAERPSLVLLLHGSMGSGAVMRSGSFYAFDKLAEQEGFIAVYP